MDLKLILACDKEFNIGKDNEMLFYIDEDLKRFKALTSNNIVIMGRRTYESLPKRPLPNRENIIYTSQNIDGVHTVKNDEELEDLLQTLDPKKEKIHYLIGGAQLSLHLKNYISECFITQVDQVYPADRSVKELFTGDLFQLQEIEEKPNFRYLYYKKKGL